jgi:hypothetical protein
VPGCSSFQYFQYLLHRGDDLLQPIVSPRAQFYA